MRPTIRSRPPFSAIRIATSEALLTSELGSRSEAAGLLFTLLSTLLLLLLSFISWLLVGLLLQFILSLSRSWTAAAAFDLHVRSRHPFRLTEFNLFDANNVHQWWESVETL